MEHSDYIKQQAQLAITLHELALRAADEKDWTTYDVLRRLTNDRSPVALLTLAQEILGDND